MEIDFSMLSLNDNDNFQKPYEYNNILFSKNIEELLINIYSYENPNITFDELRHKLIEFYYMEANEECIFNHLKHIEYITNENILADIFQKVFENNNNFQLNIIIEFISSCYGIDYLYNIYLKKCLCIT